MKVGKHEMSRDRGGVSATPSEPDTFQLAAAAMVELAAAWAKLHNALVKMGQDKVLWP